MVRSSNLPEQWDEAAESWTDFVRKGKDFYREEMNNPAFFKLVGNVKGKKTLDLACGEGSNTRILARKGAKVVGVDFSKRLIEFAKQLEKKEKLSIEYSVSDAADLKKFPSSHFDIVTCSMALMDIENYQDAIREAARVLKRNGKFVFSIVHPCFEWGDVTSSGQLIGEWKYEEGTPGSSRRALHYETTKYFGKIKLKSCWDMKRLTKPFTTTSFHRTLTDYFQALFESGLLVRRLLEPRPTKKGTSEYPQLRKHRKIPHSVIIEAVKK
jgi:ubiquinone/menaquinone biosynthesis C-methylase UbiE